MIGERGHNIVPRAPAAQSVVAFATGAFSREPYAFKFFPVRASFDMELALRRNKQLFSLMPRIQSVHDPTAPASQNTPVTDGWGRSLPPCIVLDRSQSLADWLQRATPDIFQAISVRCLLPLDLNPIRVHASLHLQLVSAAMHGVASDHTSTCKRQHCWVLSLIEQVMLSQFSLQHSCYT